MSENNMARCARKRTRRLWALLISLLVVFEAAVLGSFAYLFTKATPLTNRFYPASVTCTVTESFDGRQKSDVNAKNTGDAEVLIRLKLLSYRVSDDGERRIGGTAELPDFIPGEGWVEYGGFWYYTRPVPPGLTPPVPLIGSPGISLRSFDDADGGKQAMEIMAEAIQSSPARAVGRAWGVSVSDGAVAPYAGS